MSNNTAFIFPTCNTNISLEYTLSEFNSKSFYCQKHDNLNKQEMDTFECYSDINKYYTKDFVQPVKSFILIYRSRL